MLLLPLHNGHKTKSCEVPLWLPNLLDINGYLRSQHLKWCHCWLFLNHSSEQKPWKSEGNRSFLPPKVNFNSQAFAAEICSVAHVCCWSYREAGRGFPGWLEIWGHNAVHGGQRGPTDPHLGTAPQGLP